MVKIFTKRLSKFAKDSPTDVKPLAPSGAIGLSPIRQQSTHAQMTHTQTVQDAIDKDAQAFRALSRNYRTILRKRAFAYLAERPGCGDYIGFWRGLSARHVTQIGEASR